MNNIAEEYLTRATTWLIIMTLAYFFMNGAQIFETAFVVPRWTASPPDSFQLLADKNGVSLKMFWIIVHSLHEITFIVALIFCWKIDSIRNWLIILLVIHIAVRVWTLVYFAPNIIEFESMVSSLNLTPDLNSRTKLWQNLNYLRVGIYIAVSVALIPLILKLIRLKADFNSD